MENPWRPSPLQQEQMAWWAWSQLPESEKMARAAAADAQRERERQQRIERNQREREAQERIELTREEVASLVRTVADEHPSWMKPVVRRVEWRARGRRDLRSAWVEVERALPIVSPADKVAVGLTAAGRVVRLFLEDWYCAPVRTSDGWMLSDEDTTGGGAWNDGAALLGFRDQLLDRLQQQPVERPKSRSIREETRRIPRGLTPREAEELVFLRGEVNRLQRVYGDTDINAWPKSRAQRRHFRRTAQKLEEFKERKRELEMWKGHWLLEELQQE